MKKKKIVLPRESLLSEMDQLKIFGGVSVNPLSNGTCSNEGCVNTSCPSNSNCPTNENCPTNDGCPVITNGFCNNCWGTKKVGVTDKGCAV